MTWGVPNGVLCSIGSGPSLIPRKPPAKFLQPSPARGGSASRTSIVIPAPFDEPLITDNDSLHAWRLDNGIRPGGKGFLLAEADEKGAGAGISRTSMPVGDKGLGSLLPSESYESSYACGAPFGIGRSKSDAGTVLPL
jgi:hypothetical protein